MKDVIIIGAGGHGKAVTDVVRCSGDRVIGFLDDGPDCPQQILDIPVLGSTKDYQQYPDAYFVLAIGNNKTRATLAERISGVKWYTAIHPTAVVSSLGTKIGEGTVVMANAVINACATVGAHCVINTGAVVEHDCYVDDCAHIAVGAKISGTVTVGKNTLLGLGAVVCNNLSVCQDCVIGAGSVVIRTIEQPGTYVGVPARKIK